MLVSILVPVLLFNSVTSTQWAEPPSSLCTKCGCCVVTSEGTLNFFASNSLSPPYETIPNCYYLQTHLDEVLECFDDSFPYVFEYYTFPGTGTYWLPTDPAYGCFQDFATVTASNFQVATTLPTSLVPGGTAGASSSTGNSAGPGGNSGGCVFLGGNQTGINCNNDTQSNHASKSRGSAVRVNHTILLFCIVLAIFVVVIRGDSAGGCVITGGNQTGVNCNGNTQTINPVQSASSINIRLPVRQLIAVISIMLCVGYAMGDNNAGGCVINGGTQNGVNCSGNTQTINPSTPSSSGSDGLSKTNIIAIAVTCSTLGLALLVALAAAIVNPTTTVDGKPIRNYKRAICFKFVELITIGFICGSCVSLERHMKNFVRKEGEWENVADVVVPR